MSALAYFCLSLALVIFLCHFFPAHYKQVKDSMIKQGIELSNQRDEIKTHPLIATSLLTVAPLYYSFNHDQVMLSLFILTFGIAAYIDIVSKWVPDPIIYVCSWLSLIGVVGAGFNSTMLMTLTSPFVALLILLSINGWMLYRNKEATFGAGDVYLIASIALWIELPYVAIFIGASMLTAGWYGRKKGAVPFVPFMYFFFCLYIFLKSFWALP